MVQSSSPWCLTGTDWALPFPRLQDSTAAFWTGQETGSAGSPRHRQLLGKGFHCVAPALLTKRCACALHLMPRLLRGAQQAALEGEPPSAHCCECRPGASPFAPQGQAEDSISRGIFHSVFTSHLFLVFQVWTLDRSLNKWAF